VRFHHATQNACKLKFTSCLFLEFSIEYFLLTCLFICDARTELRTNCVLSKCFTIELYPQPIIYQITETTESKTADKKGLL
jgi:hypothetical protein